MDQLLASLAGIFAVALLRLLYIQYHHWRHQDSSPYKHPTPQQGKELKPLVSRPLVAQVSLTLRGKVVCILTATAYIVMTIFVSIATLKEYEGPVLKDSRFVLGRGGMITVALIVLARTLFYHSPDLRRELQADAVALVAIPYVMEILGTPVAHLPEREILVAPALGAICFLAAKD